MKKRSSQSQMKIETLNIISCKYVPIDNFDNKQFHFSVDYHKTLPTIHMYHIEHMSTNAYAQ